MNVVDRYLLATTDVYEFAARFLARRHERRNDIIDVNEVPRLLSVAVDRAWPTSQHLATEDRHDLPFKPYFGCRFLARSVDIRERERGVIEILSRSEIPEIVEHDLLGYAVR